MKLISLLLTLSIYAISATNVFSQEVTREEFEALLLRVQLLERQVSQANSSQIETIAAEVVSRTQATPAKANNSNIIEDVIRVIQSREENVSHPWMDAQKWERIEKGMPTEAVIAILGKPYKDEPSLHRRVDKVYKYIGRRVATNKKVEGIVRFYKNKVVDVEAPAL